MYEYRDSPFVVVGDGGIPSGHETAADAIKRYARIAPLYLPQHELDKLAEQLVLEKRISQSEHKRDCSPRSTVVLMNTPFKPVEQYVNEHLHPWPLSVKHLEKIIASWDAREGPRVGDFCERPGEDTVFHRTNSRFTHNGDDFMQTGGGDGSYHISQCGFASYSGGLDPGVQKANLVDTGRTKWASFWFFKDNFAGGHCGVSVTLTVRVYQEVLP